MYVGNDPVNATDPSGMCEFCYDPTFSSMVSDRKEQGYSDSEIAGQFREEAAMGLAWVLL